MLVSSCELFSIVRGGEVVFNFMGNEKINLNQVVPLNLIPWKFMQSNSSKYGKCEILGIFVEVQYMGTVQIENEQHIWGLLRTTSILKWAWP